MASENKSWLVNLLKRLFLCESESQPEKKTKRLSWIFGSFKKLKQLPESLSTATTLSEAREEQRKHALNVARATAAAAEAAVAAAQAAAAVVRLTGVPQQSQQHSFFNVQSGKLIHHHQAATKIQTAFRGYLARKALRALKALVRLQAIARGRSVRRHLVRPKLKQMLSSSSMPSSSSSIPSPHATKSRSFGSDGGPSKLGDKMPPPVRTKMNLHHAIRNDSKAEMGWNNTMFSKDEAESVLMINQDAIYRRDRMKQYSFSHRERHMQFAQLMDEPIFRRHNDRQATSIRNRGAEERRSFHQKEEQNFLPSLLSKPGPANTNFEGNLQLKQRCFLRDAELRDEELQSPFFNPRRSFCQIRQGLRSEDDNDRVSASSPVFPSYMVATQSAKAKMRSLSTPRQRIRYFDQPNYFENGDSYKSMRSTWSAFNSETTNSYANCTGSQLKSLSMRSLQQP